MPKMLLLVLILEINDYCGIGYCAEVNKKIKNSF